MAKGSSERDWKYLRSIQPEMLNALCARINEKTVAILNGEGTEHERYLAVYRHVHDSDEIVAECFNDWSRSNIWMRMISLRFHGLLTDEHVKRLSEETQEHLKWQEGRASGK